MLHPLPQVVTELLSASSADARDRAWEAFIADFSKLLLYVCHASGGGYDVVMDRYAFVLEHLRAEDMRRLRAYQEAGRGRFTTWLTVVARRLCVDEHRAKYGRPQTASSGVERSQRRALVDLVAVELDKVQLTSTGPDPDAEVTSRERHDRLQAALDQLGPDDRMLLRYRFDEDLPVPRIARLLGAETPFHVYRRLDKLLTALRSELLKRGITEGVG